MTSSLEELLHSKDAIDITGKIYICDDECLFEFDNVLEYGTKVMNENNLLTILPSGDSSISFLNQDYCPEYDKYTLKTIFINGPSRHSLYGKRHDVGIELVYSTEDQKQIVVITVFGDIPLSSDEKFSDSYQFFEEVASKYFPQHLKSVTLPDEGPASFNPDKLIPPQKKRTFFTYQRSQKVKQIVMENPIPIPASFIQKFKKFVVIDSQYKMEMEKKPNPPGTKIIIYATVPPTVASSNVISSEKVDVVEHFDTEVEPADEQWGYMGVVAAIVIIIFLLIGLMFFHGPVTSNAIESFIGLGPVKISMIIMIAVGTTFGMAWLIESRTPTPAAKFFSYLCWYILLTLIIIGLTMVLGKKREPMEPGWFMKLIDKCPDKPVSVNEPTVEPTVEPTGVNKRPELIGVAL